MQSPPLTTEECREALLIALSIDEGTYALLVDEAERKNLNHVEVLLQARRTGRI